MKRPLCLLIGTLLLAACGVRAGEPRIEKAWIPEAPPGAGAMAGYFTLHNGSDKALRCDGAAGTDFGAIEIHRSLIEDGQSRMLRNQIVDVPPGGQVEFERGGLHLMLFRPQRTLRSGDTSELQLRCGEVTVTARFHVERRP